MTYLILLISYLELVIGVMISVAFLIMLERKILGYAQLRKGPNKVGYGGLLQSFGDALKLFIKEQSFPVSSNLGVYYFSPVFSLLVILVMWGLLPSMSGNLGLELGGLLFFCCTSFGVYTLMGSGWSSNSLYSMLGTMRGVAQTISYEVSMALLFIGLVFMIYSYNLANFVNKQDLIKFIFMFLPICGCWLISSLAETNRTPFDFAEGESELVSGFNIEYGSGGFVLLFLSEYASIIFMSYILVILFFGGFVNVVILNLMGVFFSFMFIWVRGTLPRYRYDKLMYLSWKSILPLSLNFVIFYLMVVFMYYLWNF
uniref:NADH-ubiquinone oxidoreductase chain 1 n=1 Tax=Orthonychiurus folsomi TaxID=2581074 RepID=A0A650DR00_9HEXA|nr:NADH dehydrogenase subunit 1 [Orthonychiurus folsomi]